MSEPQPVPTPYYPPPTQPHSHIKYVVIIAVLAVLVLIIGAALGASMVSNVARTSNLNNQIDSQNSQVNSLRSQVNSLQSQVDQFNKVILKGDFTGTYDCPALSNCSYFVNGAYANVGGKTAYSAGGLRWVKAGAPGGRALVLVTGREVPPAQIYEPMVEESTLFRKLLAAAQLPLKDNLSLGISTGLDANPILDRMT